MTMTVSGADGIDVAPEKSDEKKLRAKWRTSLPWLSVAGGTALIALHALCYGGWLVDDAAITFAYSRSVSEGLGPVVQAGAAPVEGYSDPTWLVLLAVGRLLGLFDHGTIFGLPDYIAFPKALALLCCAAILAAGHLAARRVTKRAWMVTSLFGVTLAAIPSFVIWCFSGLENSLYALVVVSLAVLLFRAVLDHRLSSARVALAAGGLAAFAALTRPEGLSYGAAYPVVVLLWLRRTTIRQCLRQIGLSVGAFALPTGTYFCWRYFEFGRLLSNPTVAKGQDAPGIEALSRIGELVSYAGALAVLVLASVVGLALTRTVQWRRGLVALLVPLAIALADYAVLKPDWMGVYRFATPVWALGALIGTLAAVEVVRQARPRTRALLAAALAVATIPSAVSFAGQAEQFAAAPTFPACSVADRYGRIFNAYADLAGVRQGSLLLADLGGSSMTSRLRLIDLGGLGDSKIADYIHDNDAAGLRDYVFDEVKPTFITTHTHGSGFHRIPVDPRLAQDYDQVFDSPDAEGFPGGDWIRKDAVPSPAVLAELRAYARENTARVDRAMNMPNLTAPGWTNNCGPTLRPGQTRLSLG
ncbi:hypothetical protein ORV05_01220 [Amycolatopsis cynarae]|uniref:Glycosyltransferase RgtA/B/C/D-like domain-containing protein n=1 Tax=Amycolatopsis cynarae TaxID=2995223 RepID=A0ABY7B6S5_9PSEU|nr:hypothetical protein [Amycolatopsis sp. HUAS 11-8]WAL66473.1 hypothetical protein ORV05_01220 [Amycolatopsis sp. HUAS 11-8]